MKKRFYNSLKNITILLVIFALATILGVNFRSLGFTEPNIVVIYILAVLLTARFTEGFYYGIIQSVISILGFNYFFTEPYHTFDVYDPSYFMTFAIMAITSIITSTLTSKEKQSTKKAEENEQQSRALYNLSNQLSDADTIEKIIEITLSSIKALFNIDAGFIYFESKNKYIFVQQNNDKQLHRTSSELDNLWETLQTLRTEYAEDKYYITFPIYGNDRILGAIRIDNRLGIEIVEKKNNLLHLIIENVAMALDRIVVMNERIKDREAVATERYRANLLRAISHDLRTPLAGIMGTAEILMDMTATDDNRYNMMLGIYKDADWLHSLVQNILSLTRLQDGKIVLNKEKEALEEVIAAAVAHIEKIYKNRVIQVDIPEDFYLVPMDARLIEQVITNLLDNAAKHTKPSDNINIVVEYTDEFAKVHVLDEGDGIDLHDIPNIFEMFYTTQTKTADAKKGIGLGLSICETVIKAHGGKIYGQNRKDKRGAEFTFELPLKKGEEDV